MTTAGATAERIAAEERLLEAELATLLGRQPGHGARSRGAGPLVTAALVLLGMAVAMGTWWLQRASTDPVQEPAPLPPEERVHRTHALDDLTADVQNAACFLDGPRDFALLQRLPQLRRVAAHAYDPARSLGKAGAWLGVRVHREWAEPPLDVLAPLAALPRLEQLSLPRELAVRAEHFAALRPAPALRELSLGRAVRVDEELVTALAALPHLRALELREVALDRAAIARLAGLGLRELRLSSCPGLDATSLPALGDLRSLETLVLEQVGAPPIPRTPADVAAAATTWHPDGLSLEALRQLPTLRSLRFVGCVIDDSVLAVLPERIEELSLYSTSGYSKDGLRSLARLARLRSLRFRERAGYSLVERHLIEPRAAAAALAEVLGAVRLRSFDFTGIATRELVEALAAQPELTDLAFAKMVEGGGGEPLDLAPLGDSPSLQSLRLLNQSSLDDDALRELASCRTLRRFEAYSSGKLTQAGAVALLPGVEVKVVGFEDATRQK